MILITRPFNDAKAMSKALKKEKINSFVEPMLRITYRDLDLDEYHEMEFQSFIVTSKHAKILVQSDEPMASIPEEGENVEQLIAWIEENLKTDGGKLVYLRGEKVSYDLTGALRNKGFDIDEIVTYRTEKPHEFTERLERNWDKITAATFFSKQTLVNFLALAEQHKLSVKHMDAVVLSQNIADAAGSKFKNVHITEKANANSMIKKIAELYKRNV